MGREPRTLGGAEVDGRQRRPGQGREVAVVHADQCDTLGNVEACLAQRSEDADREQVVGAEDGVGPDAREERLGPRCARARP